ncbi:hypothetical protein PoB_006298300 [Plakobranchus ocellatus]|uniref:Uncharacterized protein n=1 Tax=Plakobranchus ocellatus TaxID=259542 RepID=A0AAV4CX76_9GAST|nr:hypothetical protein PoB_006298300 [Plakobranchus ocellatus]
MLSWQMKAQVFLRHETNACFRTGPIRRQALSMQSKLSHAVYANQSSSRTASVDTLRVRPPRVSSAASHGSLSPVSSLQQHFL